MTTRSQLPPERMVWGADRAVPATGREALDWLTLCRFIGWRPTIRYGVPVQASPSPRCIVLALDPDLLGEEAETALAQLLEREPVLVVTRAAAAGTPVARLSGVSATGGRRVCGRVAWIGPGPERSWLAWGDLAVDTVRAGEDVKPWGLVGEAPLLMARPVGQGHVVSMAVHPSVLRDAAQPGTGILRHLLLWGVPPPVAWVDLEHTLVLRMDDPGSAARSHLRSWRHPTLHEDQWMRLAVHLRARNARISVGYVPGWVDDGDPQRGTLRVGGRRVLRVPGGVHPSPSVRYEEHGPGRATHDHVSEFRGLRQLRSAGAGDVELHGYTHVRDVDRWAGAEDRYHGIHWYRELDGLDGAHGTRVADDLLGRGQAVLRDYFGTRPVALLCPGQACAEPAGVAAIRRGLHLVAADSLAVRHGSRLCWSSHVQSPYLDGPHGSWFEAGLPVVGCLHDRDIALEHPEWLPSLLDQWHDAGARRIIDFRVFAGILARHVVLRSDEHPVLQATTGDAPPLLGAVPVRVRTTRNAVALWSLKQDSDILHPRSDVDGPASAGTRRAGALRRRTMVLRAYSAPSARSDRM